LSAASNQGRKQKESLRDMFSNSLKNTFSAVAGGSGGGVDQSGRRKQKVSFPLFAHE
jgi:hypothetical protein